MMPLSNFRIFPTFSKRNNQSTNKMAATDITTCNVHMIFIVNTENAINSFVLCLDKDIIFIIYLSDSKASH